MRQRNASLRHHFHEIAEAQFEPKIPADAKNDDLPIEMAALEKIGYAQHPYSLFLKRLLDSEYASLRPFAPEPLWAP